MSEQNTPTTWAMMKWVGAFDALASVVLAALAWMGVFGGDEEIRLMLAVVFGVTALSGVGIFVWARGKLQNHHGDLN